LEEARLRGRHFASTIASLGILRRERRLGVALREGAPYVRVLQPALHYELEQVSKTDILRKLKQRFGGKTIRDIRFRVG
jgi:hypothetical protein